MRQKGHDKPCNSHDINLIEPPNHNLYMIQTVNVCFAIFKKKKFLHIKPFDA